tara:strand:- start:116 stop:2029 length:1914 start_codon:yes stop_codon:yes gene_type:complete
MIKKYSIFFSFMSIVFSQVSISDFNKLSNKQLDLIKESLKSETEVVEDKKSPLLSEADPAPATIESMPPIDDTNVYFGYDYFKRDINFFDNVPTPADFKLGPGDEIILSLWGETNSRENLVINKDGLIYYKNIGFINLSNKTLKQAESVLVEELSRVYSTLKDKNSPTKLMLELGKIKSINIYFSGQIEIPGINIIHPFSDIFSAIVQAGGVKKEGSLRKVQLIRDNEIIATVDFYSFFMSGKNTFSNIKITDGDVIHIPTIKKRIEIAGAVNRPSYYELLEKESLKDLFDYASGLTSQASSTTIIDQIIPLDKRGSDDYSKSSITAKFKDSSSISLNNGDKVKVGFISDVNSKVTILGKIKFPGTYPAFGNSLKDILDIAGGFDDPIFRKKIRDDEIIVIRKDDKQFYGLEFSIPYNKSDSFKLFPGDKIFVYENILYDNLFSISVTGAVNKRGNFQLKSGMTVRDAIDLAEGFSPLANKNAITVTEVFTYVDDFGNSIEERNQVNDATLDFQITDGSIINVLPLENVVNVEGNVYNPGLITYSERKTVKKYINLAGGVQPNSLKNKIYVKRANGRIKKVSMFRGLGVIVKPGDTIIVPLNPDPREDFNISSFVADLASTLTNIAAILVIVDRQND